MANTKPKRRADCHSDRPHACKGLCQQCYNKIGWAKRKNKRREEYFQQMFGISATEADRIKASNPLCYVCGKSGTVKNHPKQPAELHLDHDHKTGKVRGVLCFKCNTFVGFLENRRYLLPRIFTYLGWRGGNEL